MRSGLPNAMPQPNAQEAGIERHKHVGGQGTQELMSVMVFAATAGVQIGIHDGMGPTFDEQDTAHLGKGALTLAGLETAKGGFVGKRVRDILPGAIQGYETIAQPKGSFGLRGCQRHSRGEARLCPAQGFCTAL